MKTTVKVLIDGGKATLGPPLGPALGPLGVNVAQVVSKINERTASFEGMKVPVSVIVDKKTREFEIEVGSPPVAALVRKKLGVEKGAKSPGKEFAGDISFAQIVEIAKLRLGNTLSKNLASAVKEVLGTCLSIGVSVEGKDPREVQKEVDEGKRSEELR